MTPQQLPERLYEHAQNHLLHYRAYLLNQLQLLRERVFTFINRYWLRLTVITFFVAVLCLKDITIQLSLQNRIASVEEVINPATKDELGLSSMLTAKKVPTDLTKKQKKQLEYVKRFAKVAQAEMEKFGIPASITLAQGLLETNAGDSPLAANMNNHFGIKCFSKKCEKGHCANFSDDSHKDFFRIYQTAWESFRAHSQLLQNTRYQKLFYLPEKDYKKWAESLKKAGYATDQRYPEKLVKLIETLKLYEYDV